MLHVGKSGFQFEKDVLTRSNNLKGNNAHVKF